MKEQKTSRVVSGCVEKNTKREVWPDSVGRGRYIYKLTSVSLESRDLVATEGDRRVRFKRLFSRPHSRETAFCWVKTE